MLATHKMAEELATIDDVLPGRKTDIVQPLIVFVYAESSDPDAFLPDAAMTFGKMLAHQRCQPHG